MRLGGGGVIRNLLSSSAPTTTVFDTLKIGGGGFVSGMDIAADGIKVVRTDTYGAYRWNGSQWVQIVTINSMPVADAGLDLNAGVYEIAIAPSNTARFYMLFNGRVYRSDDSGATWTRTAFTQVSGSDPNNGNRGLGRKMAVDPVNADVVVVGTANNGAFYTIDAGATWTAISGIATSTNASDITTGVLIAFDPSSAVVSGKTQGVFASSGGRGVYHTTSGVAGTWTLTTGGSTDHVHMICDAAGIVWKTNYTNLYKFSAGSWTTARSGSLTDAWSVAINPADGTKIYLGTGAGNLYISTNTGSTWVGPTSIARVATDVPWLAWTNEAFMTNGDMQFDPSLSNTLYFSEGIGVWKTTPPTTNVLVTWTSQTAGIEQLVANWIVSPWIAGSRPVLGAWDRPTFYSADPTVYPSTHGVASPQVNAIVMGWGIDWASSAPGTLVALSNWFGFLDTSGISTDGGQTWTAFATPPPNLAAGGGVGGSIAASTPSNIVFVGTDNGGNPNQPYYTTNGGATWNAITISGVSTTGPTGWSNAYFLNRHILAADRVTANTFYLYNASTGGLYRSTNSGASWSLMGTPSFPNSQYNASLRPVPGNAGHLFFTSGPQSGPHPVNQLFYRTTDGGTTWGSLTGVKEVYACGFGKAQAGGYPTLYIAGFVNDIWGIWRSNDADQTVPTWAKIGDGFPLGSFDLINAIEGDANTYGTVYVGFEGSGFAYARLA